jgi:hypothetical protein
MENPTWLDTFESLGLGGALFIVGAVPAWTGVRKVIAWLERIEVEHGVSVRARLQACTAS